MLKYILITVLSTGILSGVTGNAAKAIPLEPGRVYRTGSPLSQPGIIGLGGGLVGMKTGGGYEVWNGPYVSAQDDVWDVDGAWMPSTAAQYAAQSSTMSLAEAQAAIDATAGRETGNRPRAIIPACDGQLFVSYTPDDEIGAIAHYECNEVN